MRRGFSLLEVLIAGVIFLIAVAASVSSWRTLTGLADTQARRGEAIIVAEDVLDDLRLAFRGSTDLSVGVHDRFFSRARTRVGGADPRGYDVRWTISQVPGQTFKRVDLTVTWRAFDGTPHTLPFVTYRAS